MNSKTFNELIGQRTTLLEIQRLGTVKDCPECSAKVQESLDKIQDSLEEGVEMGVVS